MSQTLDLAGGNYCTTKAGIAAGTTTTLTTANQSQYAIQGKSYVRAAASNSATPTVDSADGLAFSACLPNQGTVYAIGFDAAGTSVGAVQGDIKALDVLSNFIDAPQFGTNPDSFAMVGYILVKVGATGSSWTLGAQNLAGPPTGVTFTFVDVLTMPPRPQVV